MHKTLKWIMILSIVGAPLAFFLPKIHSAPAEPTKVETVLKKGQKVIPKAKPQVKKEKPKVSKPKVQKKQVIQQQPKEWWQ